MYSWCLKQFLQGQKLDIAIKAHLFYFFCIRLRLFLLQNFFCVKTALLVLVLLLITPLDFFLLFLNNFHICGENYFVKRIQVILFVGNFSNQVKCLPDTTGRLDR